MYRIKYLHVGSITVSSLFIFITAYYHFKQPLYDWDMLAYSAIQYQMQGVPDSQIHTMVYSRVFDELDSTTQNFLSTKPLEVRARSESDFFMEQLPFYTIKPGYNYAVYFVAWLFSATPVKAMQLVSVLSFMLTSFLLLYYLHCFYTTWRLFIITAAVVGTSTLTMAARMFTPDMLSVCFLLPIFYFMMHRKPIQMGIVYILLLLSITIRPDNLLLLFMYPVVHYYSEKKLEAPVLTISGLVIGVLLYLVIGYHYQGYGWKITFQHSAIDLSIRPTEWYAVSLSAFDYMKTLLNGLLLVKSKCIDAVFIMVLSYYSIRHLATAERRAWAMLWLLNVLFFILKFLLFPVFDDRYYLQSLLLALILIIRAIIPSDKSLHTQQ